jgi:hypothetical protein
MKFLIGLILGTAAAITITSPVETRQQFLTQAMTLIDEIRQTGQTVSKISEQHLKSTQQDPDHDPAMASPDTTSPEPAPGTHPAPALIQPATSEQDLISEDQNDQRVVSTDTNTDQAATQPTINEVTESVARSMTSTAGSNDKQASLLPLPLVQAVWSPFYSETSARGYAARLQRRLDQGFLVVKRGPAHYEVVFEYGVETERIAVLETVRELTGYEPDQSSEGVW